MSIDPKSIQVGQCYLSDAGKVRRVTGVLADKRVHFAWRNASDMRKVAWRKEGHIMPLESFARTIERAVPCGWTAETKGLRRCRFRRYPGDKVQVACRSCSRTGRYDKSTLIE